MCSSDLKAFAVRLKGGELSSQWRDMGDHMIAKCAEAQALRKAFPLDMEGLTVTEENGRPMAEPRRVPVVHRVATGSDPRTASYPAHVEHEPEPEPEPIDAQTLREAIDGEFQRLGITDHEEAAVYVYRLAGKDHGAQLGQEDLDRVLTALVDCETIEHIGEITGDPA